jgi:Amt family ammonium transporter
MLCAGCVRKKNVSNTLLKNLLDACTAAIAFFAVGFALAYGGENPESGSTFVGNQYFFLAGLPSDQFAFFFYQYTFSASAVTIIAGTLAERCRMASYLCYSFFMTAFVYPVIAHSVWSANGFLSAFATDPFLGSGALDFAGSGVVHMTGGTTALIATIVLGSRKGRFYDSTGQLLPAPKEFPGHSISLQMMGTLALWFGCKSSFAKAKDALLQLSVQY